jgi:hypothetical protein
MTAPATKVPSWWYLALAPLFLAVGIGALTWSIVHFVKAVANEPSRFDAPGEFQTTFDKPGKYAIFQQHPTNAAPAFDGSPEKPYPVCEVTSADGERQIKVKYASGSVTQGINERVYTPIYEFDIERPGQYRIITRRGNEADQTKFILGVGPQLNIAGPIASMFIGPAVCCGSTVLAVVLVIVFLVMRSSARRPPAYPPATPFPPPAAPPSERPPAPPEPDK